MTKKILLVALLMLGMAGTSLGARYDYTWKDANGQLFITDYPPPDDAEILDVSVIPMPVEEETPPAIQPQEKVSAQLAAQRRLEDKAVAVAKEANGLRKKAANLLDEAKELRRLGKLNKLNERFPRRAKLKEEEAEKLGKQIKALDQQVMDLRTQAAQMK